MQTPTTSDNAAVRNAQIEDARRNSIREDVRQPRVVQQPELLTLVLEHLDLVNRAKRFAGISAENPNKVYYSARAVEIRDYLANVDKHITELVQQDLDSLVKDGE